MCVTSRAGSDLHQYAIYFVGWQADHLELQHHHGLCTGLACSTRWPHLSALLWRRAQSVGFGTLLCTVTLYSVVASECPGVRACMLARVCKARSDGLGHLGSTMKKGPPRGVLTIISFIRRRYSRDTGLADIDNMRVSRPSESCEPGS